VSFEIIGEITQVETIATGTGIREIARLRRRYGRARWRKRKGAAEVHLESGEIVRAEIHCMRRQELESGNSRSSGFSRHLMPKVSKKLVICLDNSGYEVSLERRKIYVAIPDPRAERLGQIRIVDESGEDYLYPEKNFVPADLPQATRRAVLQAT